MLNRFISARMDELGWKQIHHLGQHILEKTNGSLVDTEEIFPVGHIDDSNQAQISLLPPVISWYSRAAERGDISVKHSLGMKTQAEAIRKKRIIHGIADIDWDLIQAPRPTAG